MGILNVTPDSFSDGGDFFKNGMALKQAEQMVKDGAKIIDVGGESTRPGAEKVSVDEEIDRVLPVVERIKEELEVLVSIDTYKERVARAAVTEAGADIVNDISALAFSEHLAETIAALDVPVDVLDAFFDLGEFADDPPVKLDNSVEGGPDEILIDEASLGQALRFNGSGPAGLLRAAVAALLNASHPEVDYYYSIDQVLFRVNDALKGKKSDIGNVARELDRLNNLGCPLN